ncbi:Protein IQ-DOMAIN 1 [Heracleum sosnowskyi]|uniref:Protein IQ-DOMAIN 1 n=1 Tax=Heracleum sosnowskyi TaxID=360622 RepID=A0AAD8IQI4_9APIA|nr:Protein IQ-DOMAIN 1 [Heracleum sosnowskyi]
MHTRNTIFLKLDATIKQPVPLGLIDAVDAESRQTNGGIQEKQNSTSRLHNKDDAATIIQSSIRSFLAQRQIEGLNLRDVIDNFAVGAGSRRSGSTGTSIEFQTGITTGVDSFRDKMGSMPQPLQVKGRPQGLKLKEDWNDSTVSINISKLRMQNRLEATTRRERALAYSFSQQLRVCPKKKHSRTKSEVTESNMGWSWLERWMATRQQENCLLDITKQYESPNSNKLSAVRKRLLFDVTGEDESCGSNEVSVQLNNLFASASQQEKTEYNEPLEDTLRPTRVSRCKTLPSYHYAEKNVKVYQK